MEVIIKERKSWFNPNKIVIEIITSENDSNSKGGQLLREVLGKVQEICACGPQAIENLTSLLARFVVKQQALSDMMSVRSRKIVHKEVESALHERSKALEHQIAELT